MAERGRTSNGLIQKEVYEKCIKELNTKTLIDQDQENYETASKKKGKEKKKNTTIIEPNKTNNKTKGTILK